MVLSAETVQPKVAEVTERHRQYAPTDSNYPRLFLFIAVWLCLCGPFDFGVLIAVSGLANAAWRRNGIRWTLALPVLASILSRRTGVRFLQNDPVSP